MNTEIFIYFGSDHRGFSMKKTLINKFNNSIKYRVIDCGTFESNTSVDYPDYAKKVCKNVLKKNNENKKAFGILICSTENWYEYSS